MDEATDLTPEAADDLERLSRRLGRYEVLTEIASGGMASVYLARAHGAGGFQRIVAIKCCHPHLRRDEDFVTMFLDEAQLAARIHHPNVVGTLDVANEDLLYLVMEYVEGDRLSGLFRAAARKKSPLPTGIVLRIICDALAGLHAAHELKDDEGTALEIVHRDVSPQNILVGIDGLSRITDFGIAKASARATVTRTGQVKGKPSYMAPEQLTGATVDRRADVFAAGIVCWEALTGRRLFDADTDAAVIQRVLNLEVDPPSKYRTDLAPDVDAAVMRALERTPERRWSTAADFAAALEQTESEVATHRAVADAVQALVGESLTARKKLVRDAKKRGEGDTKTPAPTPRSDEVATRAHTPAQSGTRRSARFEVPEEVQRVTVPSPRPKGPARRVAAGTDDEPRAEPNATPASSPSRLARTVVITAVVTIALIGVGVFAFTRTGSVRVAPQSGASNAAATGATQTTGTQTGANPTSAAQSAAAQSGSTSAAPVVNPGANAAANQPSVVTASDAAIAAAPADAATAAASSTTPATTAGSNPPSAPVVRPVRPRTPRGGGSRGGGGSGGEYEPTGI